MTSNNKFANYIVDDLKLMNSYDTWHGRLTYSTKQNNHVKHQQVQRM